MHTMAIALIMTQPKFLFLLSFTAGSIFSMLLIDNYTDISNDFTSSGSGVSLPFVPLCDHLPLNGMLTERYNHSKIPA
jgi:hypothetical protein